MINGIGSSHERRRHEIEFFQYFNNKRSPLSEYGRLLFDSWNVNDWNKFDNYFINNLQMFLSEGLAKTVSINGNAKRFIQGSTKDFFDWTEEGNLQVNKRIYTVEVVHYLAILLLECEKNKNKKIHEWYAPY